MSLALDDLAKLPSSTDTRSVPPAKPTAAASKNKTGMYCANWDGDVCSMAQIIEIAAEISMTKTRLKAVLKQPQSRRSANAQRICPREASGLRTVHRRFSPVRPTN